MPFQLFPYFSSVSLSCTSFFWKVLKCFTPWCLAFFCAPTGTIIWWFQMFRTAQRLVLLPSRELTYPKLGKGKVIFKSDFWWDMFQGGYSGIPFQITSFFLDGEGTPWLAAFWLARVCATTVPSRHPTGRIPSQQDPPGSLGWGVGGENGVVKMGGATHRGSMQSVGVSFFFPLQFFDANRFWGLGVIQKLLRVSQ